MHGAVSIFTDSQTTLMALNNYYIKSELVSETSDLLDRAAGDINTTTVSHEVLDQSACWA